MGDVLNMHHPGCPFPAIPAGDGGTWMPECFQHNCSMFVGGRCILVQAGLTLVDIASVLRSILYALQKGAE